jgi:hypothetical protein
MDDSDCSDSTKSLVADTIGILQSYMKQVEKLHPFVVAPAQSTAATSGDDSQGSVGISVNMDRQMMIFVGRQKPFQSTHADMISHSLKRSCRPSETWPARYWRVVFTPAKSPVS